MENSTFQWVFVCFTVPYLYIYILICCCIARVSDEKYVGGKIIEMFLKIENPVKWEELWQLIGCWSSLPVV